MHHTVTILRFYSKRPMQVKVVHSYTLLSTFMEDKAMAINCRSNQEHKPRLYISCLRILQNRDIMNFQTSVESQLVISVQETMDCQCFTLICSLYPTQVDWKLDQKLNQKLMFLVSLSTTHNLTWQQEKNRPPIPDACISHHGIGAQDVHLFIGLQGYGWDPIQNLTDAYATIQSLGDELVLLQ